MRTDWKFLRIVRGMNHCGGNVKFFCVWCNKTKDQREKSRHRILPVDDTRAEGPVGHEGRVAEDLFDFIPLSRTVPDLLHMFLRITDVLLEEFLKNVWDEHMSSSSETAKVEECCTKVLRSMKAAKVSFNFWDDAKSPLKVGYPSLMGPEKMKLLRTFEPEQCLERNPVRGQWTKYIWREFMALCDKLNGVVPMKPDAAKQAIIQ